MCTTIQAESRMAQIRAAFHSPLEFDRKPGRIRTANLRAVACLGIPLLLAAPLSSFVYLAAQAAAPSQALQSAQSAPKPAHVHGRPSASHTLNTPAQSTPATPAPPQPEVPKWPVNQKADPASVVWDSHGLRIEATNSSLEQILSDFSADTGAKVEGLDNDQRIFGTFGPGSAREVLAQLLEGSGYNFLIIGDQGQGTPRQIVLSVRTASNPLQAGKTPSPNDEDEVDEQPQQPQPQEIPNRPGFPPRALQQRLQQQQQQQQQQGQQPGEPPNQQPGEPPK
jgi:hypothetical protein